MQALPHGRGDTNSDPATYLRGQVGVSVQLFLPGAVPWNSHCAPRRPDSLASLGATPLNVGAFFFTQKY